MSDSSDTTLTDIGDLVRRTLAARTRDHHLIEDLTQETLVRLAAAERRLPADAQRAYAVVTARNLLSSHARGQSIHRRHIHRLVDYTGLDGPEQLTLEREETDALLTALERIDAEDRELLLRHEADGADLATLAEDADTTAGAIAMRLARARASLRLEFLLAFRHLELPTDRCRPVLLALSAGDRRRQAKLDTASHLNTCRTCAALAPPITERNRRIAGWLLVPAAETIRRAWRAIRNHPIHTAAAGIVVVAAAIVLLIPRAHDESKPPTIAKAASTTPLTAGATNAPTAAASPCPTPTPLGQLEPARALGCPFASTIVTVTDVPADEGFWASVGAHHKAWIHLVGPGESPIDIRPGQRIRIVGLIAASPANPNQIEPPGRHATRQLLYLEVKYTDVQAAG